MSRDGDSIWLQAGDFLIDLTPIFGTIKGIQQAVTGYNLVTGKNLTTAERWGEGIGAAIGVIPGLKKVGSELGTRFAGWLGKGNFLTKIDNYVDLTAHRKDHILNRHRAGAGKANKTEFPGSWSDERILHQVSDVDTDPNSIRGMGKWDSPYAIGVRDGIEIRVDFYLNNHRYAGQISTAYPINVPVNSPK